MNKSIVLCLFLLLNCSLFSNELKVDEYEAWKKIAAINPVEFLNKVDSIKSQDQDSIDIRFIYLEAFALENTGKYSKVDSVISVVLNKVDFSSDSILYYNFLSILVDQRKITDDFESSLMLQYKILDFNKKTFDTLGIINSQLNLGEIYRVLENFSLGLDYLSKATQNTLAISSERSMEYLARIYNRKAAIFLQNNSNLDSVEYYSKEAIRIAKIIKNKSLEATSSNELGFLYYNTLNPKAEFYLRNAINIWNNLGYYIYSTNATLNLSRYFEKLGRVDDAIIELEKYLGIIDESNWVWEKGNYYEILGRLYFQKNNFEKAYYFTDLSKKLLLDASEKQYNIKLTEVSNKLELRKKENELLSNKKLLETKELTIRAERDEKFVYIIFLIASILILIIFYISISKLSRQRNLLTKQKAVISKKNKELKGAASQKDVLLKEINHRVKNNLSILSSLLYLQEKDIKNKEAKMALKDSQIRIHSISLIHESLYQRDDMESVNFQDFLTNLGNFIKSVSTLHEKKVEITIKCEELKPDLSQSVSLGMILNEYFTNSFKYAFKDIERPKIKITFKNNILTYEDNGPGFEFSKENKGLGLQLIDIFLNQLNATIVPTNEKNKININLNDI
jgi:two-component sensor histidine kinase